MADREVQRRLAAILAADVAGYTRLMEQDTDGTVAAWQDARDDVVEPSISKHSGRTVKLTGDGFLAEFPTVQEAVRCAMEMQDALSDSPLDFRMGVNMGDIVDDGRDIHGEGVNVAARIEALADVGGISISGSVYEQVRNRIEATYEDRGEHEVKNVSAPVRVFAIRLVNSFEVAPTPVMATNDKPSIAVLPFDNMSGDPEQEYFSDGMAEDLITDLSKITNLSVAARNSSFSFKGQMPDVRDVGDRLGVAFVLEGSVRKMGERLRINAQLIDTGDGTHLWAERYDGDMAEIFDFQDRIRAEIVAALALQLTPSDVAQTRNRRTVDIEAYDLYLKGRENYFRYTAEAYKVAINCFERAIELDPNFADAYGYLAYCYFAAWVLRWPGSENKNLNDAMDMAKKGVSLDSGSAIAYTRLGWTLGFARRFDEAIASFEKSLSLDSDLAETYSYYGEILNFYGDLEKGLEFTEKALQLDPYAPPTWQFHAGMSYFGLGRLVEAITIFENVVEQVPKFLPARMFLTCAYAELDRIDEARKQFDAMGPGQSDCRRIIEEVWPYPSDEYGERLFNGLSKAGLSEETAGGKTTAEHGKGEKPSIAVLPFDNLSGNPEQEYFSDGITEDIITALSHIRQFFVIARNTTFTYKDRAVDVQSVAKELGVRYVLEGSVRIAGDRVRITAQLIEGETGNHIWAERYDRDLQDIFAVQDEITSMVVGAIEPELNRAEQSRARLKTSENLDAWGHYHQGVWNIWQTTKKHHLEAQRLFRRAIELDTEFCAAYAYLGFSLWRSVPLRLTDTPEENLAEALKITKQAIAIDPGNALAHMAMGAVYMQTRDHELAQRELERAIDINPGFANAHQILGWVMAYDNQPEEGIRKAQLSLRLSPNDPLAWGMYLIQAQAYVNMKDFANAEKLARQAKSLADTLPINCTILTAIGYTGNTEDAEALITEVLDVAPEFTATKIENVFPFKHQTDIDVWVDGLRKAGVPED